ncbi:MAG: periplasmic heavy metal sensor [Rhodospirillaceae bacterium]|nr:periplasmic heavy metal sensor [Rhodospirillaceae bacterium]
MTRRTLIILLIVSGALNLFVVGVIAANVILYWHVPNAQHGPGSRTAFRLYRAVDDLDEPQRARARALLEEKHPQIRAKIQAIRAARRDLRRRIRDGAVSPEAVESGFRSLQRARGEAQAALHALVRQIAESLTPDQRQRFYSQAYRPRGKKHKWRKGEKGDRGERRDRGE